MAEPYVGEIRMFAGTFAPAGWMLCEGQLLPISENETLFQLIGTTYGGDGESTFALPDLRGRIPIHQGDGFVMAQPGGAEQVKLVGGHLPTHTHAFLCTTATATTAAPQNNLPAAPPGVSTLPYGTGAPFATLYGTSLGMAGDGQAFSILQPHLCINFLISLSGIFPSPS